MSAQHTVSDLRLRVTGYIRTSLLRLMCKSWRKHLHGIEYLEKALAGNQKIIAIFWHQKYLTLLPLLTDRSAVVFTSLSSRGNAIADVLKRLGYKPVQIPDHGREKSLNIMREALQGQCAAAIAVDGPLGPFHAVHPGAIRLASELGFLIIPMSVACSRVRRISSRWDNLEVPRFFSTVELVVGKPVHIPPSLTSHEIEHWIVQLQQTLEKADKLSESKLPG